MLEVRRFNFINGYYHRERGVVVDSCWKVIIPMESKHLERESRR